MKLRIASLAAVSVLISACATTETPSPKDTLTVAEEKNTGPVSLVKSQPVQKDMSQTSQWFAVENLWPEHPYMGLRDTASSSSDMYGISFSCNTDTGDLSGALQFQPTEKDGQSGSFTVRTSNEEAYTLLGMYSANPQTGMSDFVFTTNWSTMKAIANAERSDFIDPDGLSQYAIVSDEASHRTDTKILVGKSQFEDTQIQLYYFCNPK